MTEIRDSSKASQITMLLAVLGAGILAAFLMAVGLLYNYNPEGSYLANNVLLSPEQASVMRFSEGNAKTDTLLRFSFDKIEFAFYDLTKRQWRQVTLDLEKYAAFYNMVQGEQSLVNVNDEIKALFNRGYPSNLQIKMQMDRGAAAKTGSSTFLQADFVQDYYRVQLREQAVGQAWAYFYHPGIHAQVLKLFVSSL